MAGGGMPKADVDHVVQPRDGQKPEGPITQARKSEAPFLWKGHPSPWFCTLVSGGVSGPDLLDAENRRRSPCISGCLPLPAADPQAWTTWLPHTTRRPRQIPESLTRDTQWTWGSGMLRGRQVYSERGD